jgi:hypothetical protein
MEESEMDTAKVYVEAKGTVNAGMVMHSIFDILGIHSTRRPSGAIVAHGEVGIIGDHKEWAAKVLDLLDARTEAQMEFNLVITDKAGGTQHFSRGQGRTNRQQATA